jgi:hypothetical protein
VNNNKLMEKRCSYLKTKKMNIKSTR